MNLFDERSMFLIQLSTRIIHFRASEEKQHYWSDKDVAPLTLSALQLVFICYACALLFSILLFGIEIVYYRNWGKRF